MRILLVTDTHLAAGRPSAAANLAAARRYAARGGVDLTVHLGDITRDGYSAPDELPYAAGLAADWPTPLRFIPGNHDVGDNPPGDGVPTKQPLSLEMLSAYRDTFGEDRWIIDTASSADGDGWRLIGLNAQLFATGLREETVQWEWLTHAIEDAGHRPIAVFSHKPLFQDQLDAEPAHIRYVPTRERRRVLELSREADLRLWLSGHTHQLWDRSVAGVRHIWVPSAAYRFPDVMQERLGEKIVGCGLLTLGPTGTARFDLLIPDGFRQVEYDPTGA